ncbi:hypothetical protein [Peribacillus simplex]|nr:hypothetical protein [Peribacillus simplex]
MQDQMGLQVMIAEEGKERRQILTGKGQNLIICRGKTNPSTASTRL